MREGPIVRTESWEGPDGRVWSKGMTVKIPGRRGRWTLMCHCLNRETGSEWLDIYGGPAAHQTVRSFKADAVVLPATRRKRRRAEPVDI